jgi:hypothetical protein
LESESDNKRLGIVTWKRTRWEGRREKGDEREKKIIRRRGEREKGGGERRGGGGERQGGWIGGLRDTGHGLRSLLLSCHKGSRSSLSLSLSL